MGAVRASHPPETQEHGHTGRTTHRHADADGHRGGREGIHDDAGGHGPGPGGRRSSATVGRAKHEILSAPSDEEYKLQGPSNMSLPSKPSKVQRIPTKCETEESRA